MSDIDQKLSSLVTDFYWSSIAGQDEKQNIPKLVEQIKQAFKEAGYSYQERNLFKGLKLARTVMTGQEWFDRFENELDVYLPDRPVDERAAALWAARRAAGLEQ